MTPASTMISPVAMKMQPGLLQLQFPAWEIVLARCDRDSWFEVKRGIEAQSTLGGNHLCRRGRITAVARIRGDAEGGTPQP